MGLINKVVIQKWNSANKQWYESKGYIYTKMGDTFEVKVEDLTNGSGIYVEVKCDGICNKKYNVAWKDYKRYAHKDGKYYCQKCAIKLYGTKNIRKTRLKNGKSFEQWCIDNYRQDILDRWDYELNKCKPDAICYGTGKKYYFKCPRGLHDSELKSIYRFTTGNNNITCKACNSFAQWGIDNLGKDFLEKYWDWEKNKKDPFSIAYKGNTYIYIKCQEKKYHGSYKIVVSDFTNRKGRCPYCNQNGGKVHPLDSLGTLYPESLNVWSEKNKKSIYEYSPNSHKYIVWVCENKKHTNYKRKIQDAVKCNFHCPKCVSERSESFLQEKVRLYLESLHYTILHEDNCTITPINPKTKHILPYDNEIKELKLIIEVMGEQHEKITTWAIQQSKKNNTTPEYELHYQQLKDRYKRIYAKLHGYNYLAIWYYEDNENKSLSYQLKEQINNMIIKCITKQKLVSL